MIVQGLHLCKEPLVSNDLILEMPISGLHFDLDQLKVEPTPYFTSVSILECSFFLSPNEH